MTRLLAMLAVALAALGCQAAIQHGIDEAAANEVLTSLERAGIAASKSRDESGNFSVSVAPADAVGALELLRSLGLPRGPRTGFGELYKSPSLLPTPTEERARYVEALGGEIARSLEAIDGVALARVHLVLPEPDPTALDGSARVPGRAAVLLKMRPGRAGPVAEADVQKLVAGSVPGLEAAAVSVVMTNAAAVPPSREAAVVPLGPWRVSAPSRAGLITVGAILLAVIAILAALVLVLARRLAAAQRRE
jgi:type III secretion protein J